jgi:hypothetical protein
MTMLIKYGFEPLRPVMCLQEVRPVEESLMLAVANYLAGLTPEQRVQAFGWLDCGYCRHCGYPTDDGICHCTNDE